MALFVWLVLFVFFVCYYKRQEEPLFDMTLPTEVAVRIMSYVDYQTLVSETHRHPLCQFIETIGASETTQLPVTLVVPQPKRNGVRVLPCTPVLTLESWSPAASAIYADVCTLRPDTDVIVSTGQVRTDLKVLVWARERFIALVLRCNEREMAN